MMNKIKILDKLKGGPEFGFYFGTDKINITQVKKNKVVLDLSISRAKITGPVSEQKMPSGIKIASALKAEFDKHNISPQHAGLVLAGENLIIRTFELPVVLSKEELDKNAVAYEARKYIPFKIEELVFDYSFCYERSSRKTLVLFVGIKKDLLEEYLLIFKELGVNLHTIEYSGFSLSRLFKLAHIKAEGLVGFLSIDPEDEVNFVVYRNGFPLFSRDINLMLDAEAKPSEEETRVKAFIADEFTDGAKSNFLGKLKNEIRISLDFFSRKYSTQPLNKIIVLGSSEALSEATALFGDLKELIENLQIQQFLDAGVRPTVAVLKSFSAAISKRQKIRFPIELFSAKSRLAKAKKIPLDLPALKLSQIKINPKVAFFALFLLVLGWSANFYIRRPSENILEQLRAQQPSVRGISPALPLRSLTDEERKRTEHLTRMKRVIDERLYLTKILNLIPQILPPGAWLTNFEFSLSGERSLLTLYGMIYLGNAEKEFSALSDIDLGLKNNPYFSSRFREIRVISVQREIRKAGEAEFEVTQFTIRCN